VLCVLFYNNILDFAKDITILGTIFVNKKSDFTFPKSNNLIRGENYLDDFIYLSYIIKFGFWKVKYIK
jgi:hypothetical protein